MSDMKIKAIAPWFGGKRTLAPTIVKELGNHVQYFEPFCGSCAVLFAKEPSKQETVCDLHFDLTNLILCLQDESKAHSIYVRMQRSVVGDALLSEALKYFNANPEIAELYDENRAYWYLVSSWMRRNGLAGLARQDFQLAVRWTAGGGSPSVRWRSATESLPAWHRRLLNVVCLSNDRCAFSFIPQIEDAEHTAIYVDPPYMSETRTGGEYLHDFGDPTLFSDEHGKLAAILSSFNNARIVVSYYDCQRVRKLYDGWTFVDCSRQKNLHAQNGRGSRKAIAPEVLIINGESYL